MGAYKQLSFNFGLARSQKFLFEVEKLNVIRIHSLKQNSLNHVSNVTAG